MSVRIPSLSFSSPLSLEEGRRLIRGQNGDVDTTSEVSFAAEVETMTKDEVSATFRDIKYNDDNRRR